MEKTKLYGKSSNIIGVLAVGLFSAICLLPFILVVSGSFTSEEIISTSGFSIIPKEFSNRAYEYLFFDFQKILHAYSITIVVTIVGTLIALMVTILMAYPLSKRNLKYGKYFLIFALITMLFNGGMVPWYIVCIKLGLKDNIWALIFPYIINAWNVFLLRNFFKSIPEEINESAKMDGAGEWVTLVKIILPLALPGIVTIALFISLGYWNDWWLGLMLINKAELSPLQILLRRIISNVQFFSSPPPGASISASMVNPTESIKMATCVITMGPIIFLYPYIQKYFIKGIMIGSIKG
jgi:putative aldouronate transport system permease protein